MTLDPPHEEPPGIGKRVFSVPGEGRVAACRGSGLPVVDQGGIVVVLRRVQAREGGERLGVRRLEPGGEVEQDDGGVLRALLPRGEAAGYRLGPDLRAVDRGRAAWAASALAYVVGRPASAEMGLVFVGSSRAARGTRSTAEASLPSCRAARPPSTVLGRVGSRHTAAAARGRRARRTPPSSCSTSPP